MLPFLFSLGLPALAPTLGITGMSGAALAGLGAGLGSFFETGDVSKGIKTGMLSFFGGKLLGGGRLESFSAKEKWAKIKKNFTDLKT